MNQTQVLPDRLASGGITESKAESGIIAARSEGGLSLLGSGSQGPQFRLDQNFL
jgi:hypothetical protein